MKSEELINLIESNEHLDITKFVIVQIGANDGLQDDLIRPIITKYKPKSYLVEPIVNNFNALVNNYSGYSNVSFFNYAISDIDGLKEMTTLDYDNNLPLWCKGLSTFDTSYNFFSGFGDVGLKQDFRNTELFREVEKKKFTVTVETKKLSTFLNQNNINLIDIFVTDTEGHDYIIFNQLDLDKYNPKYIIMETHTLGENTNDLIKNKLTQHGYTIISDSLDTIAFKL